MQLRHARAEPVLLHNCPRLWMWMYRFACDLNGDASLESLHVTASVGGVSFVLPLVAPTCGARTASNTKGIFCDKMPCQARVISRISRLGRAHEVSPSIVPFSPSSVYLRKSLKALGGTRNETNCRRQVGKNWMLSRQVRCRSFLRFKDCGRARDSPPGQEDAIILGSH